MTGRAVGLSLAAAIAVGVAGCANERALAQVEDDPLRPTQQTSGSASTRAIVAGGELAGERLSTGVTVFKGIPYAAPPVGRLRWREPQPVPPWQGVRSADTFGPRCMQMAPTGTLQQLFPEPAGQPTSEDCLYLNVWTAAGSPDERQPVIVWSHGGSFLGGAGSLPAYDGEALARKGVVLVTHNYRLGPFGFFAHPDLTRESDEGASGNYGLLDYVAVLQWVRDNIAAFGGDPNRVTAVGQSAGGYLVHFALTSPAIPQLFRRAIVQSAPTQFLPPLMRAEAERAGQDAAARLGAASIDELRAVPAESLLKAIPGARPIRDGRLLREDLLAAYTSGRHKRVVLLIGSNQDEGTFPYLRAADLGLGASTLEQLTTYARQRFGRDADAFLRLYPAAADMAASGAQRSAFSDQTAWAARLVAAAMARDSGSYLYYFTHRPPASAGDVDLGATHTAEIPYVFNIPRPSWTEIDRRLADTMSSYWVDFAATGDPNGPDLPTWPPFVRGDSERLLVLGATIAAAPALEPARVRLFNGLLQRMSAETSR